MLFKPSIFDTRYEGMSKQEAKLNYGRDLMLYEQAVALQKIAENNTSDSHIELPRERTVLWYEYGDDFYDIIECKVFPQYTPEYIEYEELRRQRNVLLETSNHLKIDIMGKLFFILVLSVLALPICYISKPEFFIIPCITTSIIAFSMYLIGRKISLLCNKAEKLRIQRDELVKTKYKGKKKRVH